ncbi:unnamed protein product [Effrenium voratum]|uniref:Uncharacterized protein n=1 Tax=Effrenium voratum TaxID=2562239 RepID=A0AA36NFF2_9DINO|nr:unnamed protein product [Effrenium voratum]
MGVLGPLPILDVGGLLLNCSPSISLGRSNLWLLNLVCNPSIAAGLVRAKLSCSPSLEGYINLSSITFKVHHGANHSMKEDCCANPSIKEDRNPSKEDRCANPSIKEDHNPSKEDRCGNPSIKEDHLANPSKEDRCANRSIKEDRRANPSIQEDRSIKEDRLANRSIKEDRRANPSIQEDRAKLSIKEDHLANRSIKEDRANPSIKEDRCASPSIKEDHLANRSIKEDRHANRSIKEDLCANPSKEDRRANTSRKQDHISASIAETNRSPSNMNRCITGLPVHCNLSGIKLASRLIKPLRLMQIIGPMEHAQNMHMECLNPLSHLGATKALFRARLFTQLRRGALQNQHAKRQLSGTDKRLRKQKRGIESFAAVAQGNCMACRCSMLCFLIAVTGSTFALEQPRSSLLFQYSRMQFLACSVPVWRIAFWMGTFGSKTPKRSLVWSNAGGIGALFSSALLNPKTFKKDPNFRPTIKYVNKQGKSSWQGTKQLTETGKYPKAFGRRIRYMFETGQLKPNGEFPLHASESEAQEAFARAGYSDMCEDGNLLQVARYLRQCKGLKVPEEWRCLLPDKL